MSEEIQEEDVQEENEDQDEDEKGGAGVRVPRTPKIPPSSGWIAVEPERQLVGSGCPEG